MSLPILFDAVVFDLDGTLVATDRFWVESAERGARRAFAALGLVRPMPTPAQWLALVGTPLALGFRALFPDLGEAQRQAVLAACIEEEERLLARCGAPEMPGARALVRSLHARGLKIGVASNCQRSYLEHMLDALELRALASGAYCREMPGIETKADMLEHLLSDFGTRSAVMVGDRGSDRDAAWENGLPHVHCAFGFAQGDEAVEAEGRIAALAELGPVLEGRGHWIGEALGTLGALDRPGMRLGITGGRAAGKTLFARDAARLLRARGQAAVAVSLEFFAPGAGPADGGADPLAASCDLARLERELLQPHERGEEVSLRGAGLGGEESLPPGATLLLEGPFLLGGRFRAALDRLIFLETPEELRWRRLSGRERRSSGPEALSPVREVHFPLQREHERRFPPGSSADLVLDASNPLGLKGSARPG